MSSAMAVPASASPSLASASRTVLVLDDEKNIRRAIEIALSEEGVNVVLAHDPAAALRVLHERVVDLLLLDIRLGEIDGLTFFRKMQADGFAIPTIFISGNATLTEAAQAVKIGAFDFVEKPFSAERIVVAVNRVPGNVGDPRAVASDRGATTGSSDRRRLGSDSEAGG